VVRLAAVYWVSVLPLEPRPGGMANFSFRPVIVSREEITRIRNALRKESTDLWNKWKTAEKFAKVRNVAKRTAGCSLGALLVYFDVLHVIVWARGGNWYESPSDVPAGQPYYNTVDGGYYMNDLHGGSTMIIP